MLTIAPKPLSSSRTVPSCKLLHATLSSALSSRGSTAIPVGGSSKAVRKFHGSFQPHGSRQRYEFLLFQECPIMKGMSWCEHKTSAETCHAEQWSQAAAAIIRAEKSERRFSIPPKHFNRACKASVQNLLASKKSQKTHGTGMWCKCSLSLNPKKESRVLMSGAQTMQTNTAK